MEGHEKHGQEVDQEVTPPLAHRGMRHEGRLRQHVKKWGEFFDVEAYGILRSEYAGP